MVNSSEGASVDARRHPVDANTVSSSRRLETRRIECQGASRLGDDGITDRTADAARQCRRQEHGQTGLRLGSRRVADELGIRRRGQPLHLTVIEQYGPGEAVRRRDLNGDDLIRLEHPQQVSGDTGYRDARDQRSRQRNRDRGRGQRPHPLRIPIEPALIPGKGTRRFLRDPSAQRRQRRRRLWLEGGHTQQDRARAGGIGDRLKARLAWPAFVVMRLVGRGQRQRLVVDASKNSVTQVSHA
jgi:hypothetical protein